MFVTVVTAPDTVVSLEEAKDHLRVRHNAEDALIEGMVAAATSHIDAPHGWLGRAIGMQTLEVGLPTWCIAENFALPYPPLIEIVSITYQDAQRQPVTVAADRYEVIDGLVEAVGDVAWSAARPAKNGLRVRYRAGYLTVPASIRAAILLMVGDLYRNRDTVAAVQAAAIPMSTTVDNLLSPFRVFA